MCKIVPRVIVSFDPNLVQKRSAMIDPIGQMTLFKAKNSIMTE
jgi:hypothetical protein